ncbi:MAG: transcription termination factor NusA [Rhizomicrobium sp.]
MQTSTSYPRPELLQVAETVARDKGIDRDEVLQAMEQAIQKAGRSKYGQEYDIRAEIDRKNGEIRLMRFREVAEPVENEATQIPLGEARRINPEAEVGDFLTDPLPPIDFGRIAAQTAKQVIVQKVRDAERERQYDEYKDRIGEIVHGIVKRVEFGSVVVDLGRAEGVVRRDEMIPRESFRTGDRIRAYIYDVRRETRGPQIFLSRSHPQFMVRLFAQEVPEIYDGIIEIRAVARDPGSRAKIAVISKDSSIDPVGACVGMRGVRVQAVVQELQGERIDIIPWNTEAATFIVNALAPAEVSKVVLDEDTHRTEVVVPDEQLSLAIGRRGQNVRLASQLTGWQLDIMTEAEESERRQKEFTERTTLFMDSLDVDETVAQLLASEGFASIEDVAFVPLDELAAVEGFDEETAQELQTRAIEFIEAKNKELDDKRKSLGVDDDVLEVAGVTPAIAVALGENEVKTVEDLAGCATDDLIGYYETNKEKERVRVPGFLEGFNLTAEDANAIIMTARVKAGWVEEEPEPEVSEEEVAEDGEGEEAV